MADILIRGMEMPKGDNTISITIFSNGKVSLAHDKEYAEYAEAVLLSEGHGRLIDADVLKENLRTVEFWNGSELIVSEQDINDALTIVPAE